MDKKRLIFPVFMLALFSYSAFSQKVPVLAELEEVAQLPAKVPQRVTALAFDGEKLWFAIYLGRGQYVTYDPTSGEWNLDQDPILRASISKVTGQFASAAGMVFVDGKMWLGSAYGDSFGWIDVDHPDSSKTYARHHLENHPGTQSYADFASDGEYIWSAWSVLGDTKGRIKNEMLLKIDKETGAVVDQYTLLKGNRPMMSHGLTYDGHRLWHVKENLLSSIDKYGVVTGQFELSGIKRADGLAWDGHSLWIVEFNGKLWRLPFKDI